MLGPYLQNTLDKQVVFFTGKGGVGKSVVTWATALAAKAAGKKVIVVSWNPFDAQSKPFPADQFDIRWERLDPTACFHEYALGILKFEKIYEIIFQNRVLKAFVDAAPGLAESMIAGKIWELTRTVPDALFLVDLPSSGHALTFFSSPLGLNRLFQIGIIHRETERIKQLFFNSTTRIDLVTLPEELPATETIELHHKLSQFSGLHLGYLLLNQSLPDFKIPPKPQWKDANPAWISRYVFQKEQEKASQEKLASLKLPQVLIPKVTAPTWLETVQAVATHLKGGQG